MKILLTCNAGMSTSLLAEIMRQVSSAKNMQHEVWCIDIEKVEEEAQKCDILLLGPQVRHTFKRLQKQFEQKIPVVMIPVQYYGQLNGEGVLNYAIEQYHNYYI